MLDVPLMQDMAGSTYGCFIIFLGHNMGRGKRSLTGPSPYDSKEGFGVVGKLPYHRKPVLCWLVAVIHFHFNACLYWEFYPDWKHSYFSVGVHLVLFIIESLFGLGEFSCFRSGSFN